MERRGRLEFGLAIRMTIAILAVVSAVVPPEGGGRCAAGDLVQPAAVAPGNGPDAADADGDLPPDLARIKRRGALRVVVNPGMGLPLCEEVEGELRGLEPTIARELAETLGVKAELIIERGTPEQALALVRGMKADMAMADLTVMAERAVTTPFGDPYAQLRSAFMVADMSVANEDGFIDIAGIIKKLNDPDIRLGVRKDSYHEELVRSLTPRAKTVSVAGGWDELLGELQAGRIDAILSDELQCVRSLRQYPERTVFYSVYILKDRFEHIAAAFNWRDRNLILWYNSWVREVFGDFYDMGELMRDFPDAFAARKAVAPPAKRSGGDGK